MTNNNNNNKPFHWIEDFLMDNRLRQKIKQEETWEGDFYQTFFMSGGECGDDDDLNDIK